MRYIALALLALTVSGCASVPQSRTDYSGFRYGYKSMDYMDLQDPVKNRDLLNGN